MSEKQQTGRFEVGMSVKTTPQYNSIGINGFQLKHGNVIYVNDSIRVVVFATSDGGKEVMSFDWLMCT